MHLLSLKNSFTEKGLDHTEMGQGEFKTDHPLGYIVISYGLDQDIKKDILVIMDIASL